MNRFKALKKPLPAIDAYLKHIYIESCDRGYCFNRKKFGNRFRKAKINVTKGQIDYEFNILKKRLKIRAKDRYKELIKVKKVESNSVFRIIKGKIEDWEKV